MDSLSEQGVAPKEVFYGVVLAIFRVFHALSGLKNGLWYSV
jgi:hypothetical protein